MTIAERVEHVPAPRYLIQGREQEQRQGDRRRALDGIRVTKYEVDPV